MRTILTILLLPLTATATDYTWPSTDYGGLASTNYSWPEPERKGGRFDALRPVEHPQPVAQTERIMVVYTMPNCPACTALKSRLRAAGTEFIEDKSMPGFNSYPQARWIDRPGGVSVTEDAAKPATAICQCQGSNHGVCFCLQNKIQCKCHATKGSEWNLDDSGRAVSKTGQYGVPTGVSTQSTSSAESRSYSNSSRRNRKDRPGLIAGVFNLLTGKWNRGNR